MNQSNQIVQQVSFPEWMMYEANPIQRPLRQFLQAKINKQKDELTESSKHQPEKSFKRDHPVNQDFSSQNHSQRNNSLSNKSWKKQENKEKAISQRRCQNAKKYRQKKKEYIKLLEQQNHSLNQKVKQLELQLNQAEAQINKLSHKDFSHTTAYDTLKAQCLAQIQTILDSSGSDDKKTDEVFKKMRQIQDSDGKHKLDLLNYFMSQLLQNLVNQRAFYVYDSMVNKIGICGNLDSPKFRKIDIQVIDILKFHDIQSNKAFIQQRVVQMTPQAEKLKQLWKKMYRSYLDILNQCFRMERISDPVFEKKYIEIQKLLRLELHFQKNKKRSDIRQIRTSWFKQLQRQNINQMLTQNNPTKRIKLSS